MPQNPLSLRKTESFVLFGIYLRHHSASEDARIAFSVQLHGNDFKSSHRITKDVRKPIGYEIKGTYFKKHSNEYRLALKKMIFDDIFEKINVLLS